MSVGGATMEAVLLPPQSQSHRRCHGAELSPQSPSPNLSLEFCHRPRIFFSEGHGDLLHIWINLCSQKSLPFMFKRYMQTSTDHARKYGGTWLVLAICMQLAELMDGTQTVVSNENEGSTLKLSQGFHYQWYRRFLCFQAKSTTFSSVPIATNLMV